MFRKLGELGRGSFGVVEKVRAAPGGKSNGIGTMVYQLSCGSDSISSMVWN